MKPKFARIVALAISSVILASNAFAQMAITMTMPCFPTKEVESTLAKKFSEQVIGFGITKQGILVRSFVSEKGSFTIAISRPDGITCFAAAGDGWTTEKPKTLGNDL